MFVFLVNFLINNIRDLSLPEYRQLLTEYLLSHVEVSNLMLAFL